MSQYSTGLSSVTNGSPTVTGTNTLWLANVTAGDSFTVAGVMYDVASVDSDTQITLSAPYAGTTASGVVYAIGTGFTVPDSFPEMSQGDIETATIFTRAMRGIQGKFSSILAGGANANFTTMPQVGGDPVVESGSNADGEWTRWSDGTQICSRNSDSTDITFPSAFVSIPNIVAGDERVPYPGQIGIVTVSGITLTEVDTRVYYSNDGGSSFIGSSLSGSYIAIGRWK